MYKINALMVISFVAILYFLKHHHTHESAEIKKFDEICSKNSIGMNFEHLKEIAIANKYYVNDRDLEQIFIFDKHYNYRGKSCFFKAKNSKIYDVRPEY